MGKNEQPEAAGVVGFTPLLEPGASFIFGSGAALKSPRGYLVGNFLAMVEPELAPEDAKIHKMMEKSELFIRFQYLKGLEAEKFHVPLPKLSFDMDIPCGTFSHSQ